MHADRSVINESIYIELVKVVNIISTQVDSYFGVARDYIELTRTLFAQYYAIPWTYKICNKLNVVLFTDKQVKLYPVLGDYNLAFQAHLSVYEQYQKMLQVYARFSGQQSIGLMYPVNDNKLIFQIDEHNVMIDNAVDLIFIGPQCEIYYEVLNMKSHRDISRLHDYIVRIIDSVRQQGHMSISEIFIASLTSYYYTYGYNRVIVEHYHCNSDMHDNRFHPYVYLETPVFRLFRSDNGYIVYSNRDDYDKKELLSLLNANPITHVVNEDIKVGKSTTRVDANQLLKELRSDIYKLNDVKIGSVIYTAMCQLDRTIHSEDNVYKMLLNYLRVYNYIHHQVMPSCHSFCLVGKAGIGKTEFVRKLTGTGGMDVYNYTYDRKTKQYYDGYIGQPIVVADDLGQTGDLEEWDAVFRFCRGGATMLPKSQAGSKDLIPALARELYITTNHIDQLYRLPLQKREAIGRRMDVLEFKIVEGEVMISHQVYDREADSYRQVQLLTVGEMLVFIQVCHRRTFEPYQYMPASINIALVLKKLAKLHPAIGLVAELYELATGSSIECYAGMVYVVYSAVSLAHKHRYITSLLAKHRLTKRDVRYLQCHESDTSVPMYQRAAITDTLYSESSVVSVRPDTVMLMDSGCYGFDMPEVVSHLKENLQFETGKFRIIDQFSARVPTEEQRETAALFGHEIVSLPPQTIERVVTKHRIINPTPIVSAVYSNKWFEHYLPLADTYVSTIDESEYKPFGHIQTVVNKQKFGQVMSTCRGLIKYGNNNAATRKRRLERIRQRARIIV